MNRFRTCDIDTFSEAMVRKVAAGVQYIGLDERTFLLIVETILRLPDQVVKFALEQCIFLSVGDTAGGIAVPGKVGENRWLVVLKENLPKVDAHSIVAHEIAHSYLGHDLLSPWLPPDCETHAAQVAAAWGFIGLGADPDQYSGIRCGDWESYTAAKHRSA